MIRKYTLIAPVCCLLVPTLAILTGCGQPDTAPAKSEGLASVPPQPAATPQAAASESATPATTTPPVQVEPAAQPAPATPKEPPAAVAMPVTEMKTASPALDTTNLIPEGGWEQGYPGWQKMGKADVSTDDTVRLFGTRSLRIDTKGKDFQLVRWGVVKDDIKESDQYVLKGYLKLQDIATTSKVHLTAFTTDSKTKKMSWFKSQPLRGLQGWTEVAVQIQIPKNTSALGVRIEYDHDSKEPAKPGTIWSDGLVLTPVTEFDKVPKNMLDNGGFDAFTNKWRNLTDPKHLASDQIEKALSGSTSLRIDATGLDKASLIQWASGIKPNTTYRLDGYIKVKDLQGNVFFAVVAENSQRKNKTWLSTKKVTGTSDWRKLSLQFKTGPDTNSIGVTVTYECYKSATNGSGVIWIDNISVCEVL